MSSSAAQPTLLLAAALLCGAPGGALAAPGAGTPPARPTLQTPKRIVLGARRSVRLRLGALPGEGKPLFTLNVGRIRRVKELKDGSLALRLRLPRKRSPQELLLLAQRERGPIFVYRVPLLGRTRLRIRAKPRSTITFRYADQELTKPMGRRRSRRFRLIVPPGVDSVRVEVVDRKGDKTERDVKVERPSYRRLVLGATPKANSEARPHFAIVGALAEGQARKERPRLEVKAPGADWRVLPARIDAEGTLHARLLPRARGEHTVRVMHGGQSRELKLQAAHAVPLPASRPTSRPAVASRPAVTPAPPAPAPSRWHLDVSLAAGMLYNTGELLSPLFTLGLGVSYELGRAGSLGLRLGVGFAWDSQTIAGPPGLGDAESSIFVLPLTLGPFYRGPSRWLVVPYVGAAFALQLVIAQSEASFADAQSSTEVAPGVWAWAGAELPLGIIAPFIEAGFLYSRVESPDVELLAGGLLVLAGARLRL